MTVSEELRQWAVYDKRADVNSLRSVAWHSLCEFMDTSWGLAFGYPRDCSSIRTFALLVACALED